VYPDHLFFFAKNHFQIVLVTRLFRIINQNLLLEVSIISNSSKQSIEGLIEEIRSKIGEFSPEEDFRDIISEDIELAAKCFNEKNIPGLVNCLTFLVARLHTSLIVSACPHPDITNLLFLLHDLQQILIKLPICIVGPSGPRGATGATGATGPCGIFDSAAPISSPQITGPSDPAAKTALLTNSCPVCRCRLQSKPPHRDGCNFSTHTQVLSQVHKRK
jgi:hypothetical protein